MPDLAPTIRLIVVTVDRWGHELVKWQVLPNLSERFAADVAVEPIWINWGRDEAEAFRALADVIATAHAERQVIASLWIFDWYDGVLGGGQLSEADRAKCPWLVSNLGRPLLHEVIENLVQRDDEFARGTVVFVREPRSLDTNMDRINSLDQLSSAISDSGGKMVDFADASEIATLVGKELGTAIEEILAEQQQTLATGPLAGKRVLVVDSDENVGQDAKQLLKNYGCLAADTATNGADAISMVAQAVQSGQAYDVVVADQRLVDMAADELLAHLEQIIDPVPFVMMTAFGYDPGHSAIKIGRKGHAVLFKPFHVQQLISALADATAPANMSPEQAIDEGAPAMLGGENEVRIESPHPGNTGEAARETLSPPPHLDENVQFTVYRPRTIAPQRWYPMLAFAHLSERPNDAPDEPDPIQEVQRQAQQILGEQASDYQDATHDSFQAVPREGEITLVPQMDGVEFNPPRRTFLWQESVHRDEFRLKASPHLNGKTARGRLTVFLGSIVLADVPIAIRVDDAAPNATEQPLAPTAARPYRRIFASYSHHDLQIVEQFERLAITLGDEYLRDWTSLRSGQVWQDELLDMIREADIFQLFWSTRSMASPHVRKEWEFALSLNREQFVRPLYWEQPLPENRTLDLPPDSLTRLHFQLIPISPREESREPASQVTMACDADLPRQVRVPPPRKRPSPAGRSPDPRSAEEFEKYKLTVCETLVGNLDLSATASMDEAELRKELRQSVEEICRLKCDLLSLSQREQLIEEVLDETLGLGPLEQVLRDPTVTGIFINGPAIFLERGVCRERAVVSFRDRAHAEQILLRMAGRAGQSLGDSQGLVDIAIPKGHMTAVITPGGNQPVARITRQPAGYVRWQDWLARGVISHEMAEILEAAVRARMNIVVCGAVANVSAALVKAMVPLIDENAMVALIEPNAENQSSDDEHVLRLSPESLVSTDPASPVNFLDTLLKLQPDRICATELSPDWMWDLLDLLQHECRGSLLAVSATDAEHAMERMEAWILRSAPLASPQSAQRQLATAIDLFVQIAYSSEGELHVQRISELEFEDDGGTLRDVAVKEE